MDYAFKVIVDGEHALVVVVATLFTLQQHLSSFTLDFALALLLFQEFS
jgi:hypothetical protein